MEPFLVFLNQNINPIMVDKHLLQGASILLCLVFMCWGGEAADVLARICGMVSVWPALVLDSLSAPSAYGNPGC